ncbi:hypothetical protein C1M49_01185 [Streptococcus intermedius]|nr:hypothetical protein C1M49_01185 [Streptococcus intermedius]
MVNLISSFKVAFRYIMASESDSRKLVLLYSIMLNNFIHGANLFKKFKIFDIINRTKGGEADVLCD